MSSWNWFGGGVPSTINSVSRLILKKIFTLDEDFETSGLRVSSALRLHRMMTATIGLIQRDLGQLSKKKQAIVRSRLKALFGLE